MKFVNNREPIFSERLLASGLLLNFILSVISITTYIGTGKEIAFLLSFVTVIFAIADIIMLEYINWDENKKRLNLKGM